MARGEVLSGACAYFGAARRLTHCVRGRTDRWAGRQGRSDCASKRAVACKKRAKWGSQIVRCLLQECRVVGGMTRDATMCTSVMNGSDERWTTRAEWLMPSAPWPKHGSRHGQRVDLPRRAVVRRGYRKAAPCLGAMVYLMSTFWPCRPRESCVSCRRLR